MKSSALEAGVQRLVELGALFGRECLQLLADFMGVLHVLWQEKAPGVTGEGRNAGHNAESFRCWFGQQVDGFPVAMGAEKVVEDLLLFFGEVSKFIVWSSFHSSIFR
jgi:hypothetical protein